MDERLAASPILRLKVIGQATPLAGQPRLLKALRLIERQVLHGLRLAYRYRSDPKPNGKYARMWSRGIDLRSFDPAIGGDWTQVYLRDKPRQNVQAHIYEWPPRPDPTSKGSWLIEIECLNTLPVP